MSSLEVFKILDDAVRCMIFNARLDKATGYG